MPSLHVVRKRLADGSVKEYRYARGSHGAGQVSGTVGALVEAYYRSPEWAALALNTKKSYRQYFDELTAAYGPLPVKGLQRRYILATRDAIAANPERGPATATRFARTVAALLSWAVERDMLAHNPLVRIKSLPGGHLRAWTEAEYARILPALAEPLRRVVILARFTGQRRGDLVGLRWPAYDGRALRLTQQKTRASLVIPVVGELRREMDTWRPKDSLGYILTTDRARPWRPNYLSRLIGEAVVDVDPSYRGLNIHGLRKLAAASLAEAGCSMHEIAAITGHSTLAMVQLYTRSASQERLAEAAVVRLETARGNRRKPAG